MHTCTRMHRTRNNIFFLGTCFNTDNFLNTSIFPAAAIPQYANFSFGTSQTFSQSSSECCSWNSYIFIFFKKKTITSLNFALINFPEFIRYNYQSAGQMIKRRVHALIQSLSYHMTRLALFYQCICIKQISDIQSQMNQQQAVAYLEHKIDIARNLYVLCPL